MTLDFVFFFSSECLLFLVFDLFLNDGSAKKLTEQTLESSSSLLASNEGLFSLVLPFSSLLMLKSEGVAVRLGTSPSYVHSWSDSSSDSEGSVTNMSASSKETRCCWSMTLMSAVMIIAWCVSGIPYQRLHVKAYTHGMYTVMKSFENTNSTSSTAGKGEGKQRELHNTHAILWRLPSSELANSQFHSTACACYLFLRELLVMAIIGQEKCTFSSFNISFFVNGYSALIQFWWWLMITIC